METLNSENKKRVLPSWMTAPVDERRESSMKSPRRKTTAAVQAGVATRAPVMRTVYCMNEAEMVEVALEVLIEGRKQEAPTLVATDKLRLSPPYSASPSPPGSSSGEEGSGNCSPALGLSPSQGPEATDSPCSRSPKEEEEDALKYVREIFFS
ncbi:Cyren [Phodopus roborovskii]|uniref:Cyren protein n=2 Tax=Phodopus roborovskii TaxID=109678 RepID=A0AAU9YSZ8_PHORO|nr:Cyren [Phodopus roborovskii]